MLFVGDVLDSNDDRTGTFSQLTLERVRVVEIFKGLPNGTEEVWLNPSSGTSCYAALPVGRRYLIDGFNVTKVSPDIADQSRNYKGDRKPLPAGFDPATALVVSTSGCGRSALAEPQNEDLSFLQAYKANRWQPRVSGFVDQVPGLPAFRPQLPVGQAKIRLSGPSGEIETLTDSDGSFEFRKVKPGQYLVSMEKQGFTATGPQELMVPAGGCGWWPATAKTNGRMRIQVTTRAGAPLADVPVSLQFDAAGKLTPFPTEGNARTNAAGLVDFSGLAAATYVISVNPGGPRSTEVPYPATFHPGVPRVANATRVSLRPNEEKLGLTMILPEKIPLRRVKVQVLSNDGKPVAGATVFAQRGGVKQTDGGGMVELSTLSGFDDKVSAWKEFDNDDGRKPWIDWKRWIATVELPGRMGDAKIEVRFEKWVRNGDRQ